MNVPVGETQVLSKLAVFRCEPAFKDILHVGRPNIGDKHRLFERWSEMLNRNWLTNNGPYVCELEQRLAEFISVKHCVAVCNATVGLELASRACDLSGEVIVPSFTFIATAHALQWQGITPVFCDIDPVTHNLDPRRVEELITPHTTGIVGVHVWGRACPVDELQHIAERHGLTLLFDAAHAFACTYQRQMIGNFGRAEVFSFHATKFFNTLEGGAIVTNDDLLAAKLRLMRNFGFTGMDSVDYIGTNGKMSEASAAMGLTSLESLDEFMAVNYRNYKAYQNHLEGIPGCKMVTYDECQQNNYQYIVLEIDEECGLSRDELVAVLHAENVRARRYFYPGCHEMEPYRTCYPDVGQMLPETMKLTRRVMCLPTGTAVNEDDIAAICAIIRTAINNSEAVKAALARYGNQTS